MHNQILTDAQVIDLIHAYGELPPLSGSKDVALVRLTNSIYRMEVTYISKLVKCKSETEVDIQFLANEATFEFLDRYVIRQAIDFVPGMPVLPLLKRIARSKVLNAIRDSRRRCRYPDFGRVVHLNSMDSVKDAMAGNLPSSSLAFNELVLESELTLSDPIKREAYRLLIDGFTVFEIATRMNLHPRAARRILGKVRSELLPWCESNLVVRQRAKSKEQRAKSKEQGARSKELSLARQVSFDVCEKILNILQKLSRYSPKECSCECRFVTKMER